MKTKKLLLNSCKKGILILVLILWPGLSALAQIITIQGNKFYVDSSKRIWLNGVDGNGDITTIGPATLSFKNNHTELVYPLGTTSVAETVSDEPFIIYPNPSSGKFTLDGTRDKRPFQLSPRNIYCKTL